MKFTIYFSYQDKEGYTRKSFKEITARTEKEAERCLSSLCWDKTDVKIITKEEFNSKRYSQFTVEEAYLGNSSVLIFENGFLISEEIISDYEVPGFTLRLKNEGFRECVNHQKIEEKINELRSEIEALEAYQNATTDLYRRDSIK